MKALLGGAAVLYLFGAPWWLLYLLVEVVIQGDMPAWLNAIAGAGILFLGIACIGLTALLGLLVRDGMEATQSRVPESEEPR